MVKPPPTEKSYHIFYQMMAGLSVDERSQLGLEGYTVRDLMYLNLGKVFLKRDKSKKEFDCE